MDVTVGIGPTFFSVKQELVSTVTVTEPTPVPPFGTPTLDPVVIKGSIPPVGVNIGADFTYMIIESHRGRRAAALRAGPPPISDDQRNDRLRCAPAASSSALAPRIRF